MDAIPGGFQGNATAIGAVKPGLRLATTFNSIEPPRTMGTLGSTISTVNGASSVTATASESTVRVQNGTLFWPSTSSAVELNSQGTCFEVSVGLPLTFASVAPIGALASARKRTGMTELPAVISSASTVTPGGRLSAVSEIAPLKSSRRAWIRIAWRFPLGTAGAITLVPRRSDSLGVLSSSLGVTGLISTR